MSNSGDTSEKKQWEELKEVTTDRLLLSNKPASEIIRRIVQRYLGKGLSSLKRLESGLEWLKSGSKWLKTA
jgi:hypothetical protein